MVEPDWVVKNQVVIAPSPTIANAVLIVDDQSVYIKHFEASGGRKPALSSSCDMLELNVKRKGQYQ